MELELELLNVKLREFDVR